MSKISDLAKSFEETSKRQESDTAQTVSAAFKQHEERLKGQLNESTKRIVKDIHAQRSRLMKSVITPMNYVIGALVIGALALILVLMFQGYTIQKRLETQDQMQATINELESRGGGLELNNCGEARRLCVRINKNLTYQTKDGATYATPTGY